MPCRVSLITSGVAGVAPLEQMHFGAVRGTTDLALPAPMGTPVDTRQPQFPRGGDHGERADLRRARDQGR